MTNPSDSAFARLRAFAGAAASGAPSVPIPGLEDDLHRRTAERDDLEILHFSIQHGVHEIEAVLNRPGTEGEMHEAVLYLLAWAGHRGMFIEKSPREAGAEYHVVCQTPKAPGGADFHAIHVMVHRKV